MRCETITRYYPPLLRCAVILLLGALPSVAVAGAWTLPEGESQVIFTQSVYRTNNYYNKDGDKTTVGEFFKTEISPYVEYGLTDSLTIGFTDAYQNVRVEPPDDEIVDNQGHSGAEFFLRKRLYSNHGLVLSVQPTLKTPAHYEHSSGPKAGLDNYELQTDLLAGYGWSLWDQNHYVNVTAGYRKRSGVAHDQAKFSATLGLGIIDGITLMPEYYYTRAQGGVGDATESVSGINDYHLGKAQLSVLLIISDELKLQLGGYRNVYARNTGGDNGGFAALWVSY